MAGINPDDALFKCPTCQALLWTLEEFEAHFARSSACYQPPQQPTPYKCYVPLCPDPHFNTLDDLTAHVDREHDGEACPDCHRWLNAHKGHRGPCNRYHSPRYCHTCDIGFATNAQYDWHIKAHQFKCTDPVCRFLTLRSRSSAETHTESDHQPMPSSCARWKCLAHPNEDFETITSANVHRAQHKGQYKCPYCTSTLIYSSLKRHIDRQHPQISSVNSSRNRATSTSREEIDDYDQAKAYDDIFGPQANDQVQANDQAQEFDPAKAYDEMFGPPAHDQNQANGPAPMYNQNQPYGPAPVYNQNQAYGPAPAHHGLTQQDLDDLFDPLE